MPADADPVLADVVDRGLFLVDLARRLTGDPATLETELAAPTRRRLLAASKPGVVMEVERVPFSDLTPATVEQLANAHRPVVLAGACAGVEATRWSVDDMDRLFGEFSCALRTPDEPSTPGRARDLLDRFRDGSANRTYLDNASDIPAGVPGFREAVGVDRVAARLPTEWSFLAAQVFLGGALTSTPSHCADNTTLFFQLQGRKHWAFVHQAESARMYAYPSTSGIYRHSPVLHADPATADTYPLYPGAQRLTTTLEPGDVLLLPRWWWHEVWNEGGPNFGVTTRWGPPMYDRMKDQNIPYLLSNTLMPSPALEQVQRGGALRDAEFRRTYYDGILDRVTVTREGKALLPDFRRDREAGEVDPSVVADRIGSMGRADLLMNGLAAILELEGQADTSVFRGLPFPRVARHLARWKPGPRPDPAELVGRFLEPR
ncbi:MAG: cupin-like domain-containing protein [Alphaproteobacteria bacterium]|nr:cupin-like domain-containing protein [Alphaproteobacteria bacterium]